MNHKKPLNTILIKPSSASCNLNCNYCFYLEKDSLYSSSEKKQMKLSTLEELIKQSLSQNENQVGFVWQGGEPTLMGLDFFKKAIDYQLKYGRNIRISNVLQTNGTLLNEDWINFLTEYNFLVGISIDGPQNIHDYYRKHKDGKPSWEKVFKNAKLLLNKNIAVNSLSCVTNYSAKYPDEIYNFLYSNGFNHFQFIPIIEMDKENDSKAANFSVSVNDYGIFLCRIFDLWKSDFSNGIPKVSVRFFDDLFYNYIGLESPNCTFQHECGKYVVVEYNGDVYSCDFHVEDDFHLGNIHNTHINEFLNSNQQLSFGQQKTQITQKCKNCKWLAICHGGCLKDRRNNPNEKNQSYFCDAYKMVFEYAHPFMKDLAEKWLLNYQKRNKTLNIESFLDKKK